MNSTKLHKFYFILLSKWYPQKDLISFVFLKDTSREELVKTQNALEEFFFSELILIGEYPSHLPTTYLTTHLMLLHCLVVYIILQTDALRFKNASDFNLVTTFSLYHSSKVQRRDITVLFAVPGVQYTQVYLYFHIWMWL